MESDDQHERDFLAAQDFLIGHVVADRRGLHSNRYHAKGSAESENCRAALIRLLRDLESPFDAGLRETLADMFETDASGCVIGWAKLEVRQREAHRPSGGSDAQIANFIFQKVREGEINVETAVIEAIDKFEVSREFVYRSWSKFKPLFERSGRLPGARAKR